MSKALDKMIATMMSKVKNPEQKVLAISHCNCPKRAQDVMEKAKSLGTFKDVLVIDTAGISSLYACDGGVIMAI